MLRSQCSNSCRLFANNYTYHSTPSPGRTAGSLQRQPRGRIPFRLITTMRASVPRRWSTELNTRITCPVRRLRQKNGAATCACTCTMQTTRRLGCSTARQAWRPGSSRTASLRRTCKGTSSPSTRRAEPR